MFRVARPITHSLLALLTAGLTGCVDPGGSADEGAGGAGGPIGGGSSVGGSGGAGTGGGGTGAVGPGCEPEVTAEALEGAIAALGNGADEVDLDATGCLRYRRTLVDDQLTHEEVLHGGVPELVWDYTDSVATGTYDRDGQGNYQTTITVQRGATPVETVVVVERGVPIVLRETLTDTGTGIHVVAEDLSGTEPLITEYDTGYYQPGVTVDPGSGAGACTDQAAADLLNNWNQAYSKGLKCLWNLDMKKAAIALAYVGASGIRFKCVDLHGDPQKGWDAQFSVRSWLFDRFVPYRASEIQVHGPIAGSLSQGLLFHELMHAYFPRHSGPLDPSTRYHTDQIYACQATCFDVGGQTIADKCTCATCLDTDPCDPRCAQFADCPQDNVWLCPCEGHEKTYTSEWDCAVDCYNSMACFDAPACEPLFDTEC